MQFNSAVGVRTSLLTHAISQSSVASYRSSSGSQQASDEIYAYITARDLALAEAERQTSQMTLNRAFLANQLVENSLRPARSPYQAQCLPETDASRERKRCENVKTRIVHLRAAAKIRDYECAAAA